MASLSRRTFIQLTVFSGAATATGLSAGCSNERIYKAEVTGQYGGYDNRVEPYVNQPDGLQDGVPQYFATTCQMCPAGCGLMIRTIGGRAHKVEGNPSHLVNLGKTCARGQAALQHLYSPERLRFPKIRPRTEAIGQDTDWETALARLAQQLQKTGPATAILVDAMTIDRSPTLTRLLTEFAASVGATVTSYALLDDAPWRAAAQAIYGRAQVPSYQIDQADYLLAFSANFLETWPSPVYYSRLFGEFRQGPRRAQGSHGRFVFIGPRMSMTAAKADQWIPCNPGTEAAVASGIWTALGGPGMPIAQAASLSGISEAQITQIAQEFAKAGPRAVALGGDTLMAAPNGTEAMIAVENLNAQVQTSLVGFGTSALATDTTHRLSGLMPITHLIQKMQAGQIQSLLILGQPNPSFTLPPATQFDQAMQKVPFVAALTPFVDETSRHADLFLPTRTFLEEWGDDVPSVIPAGSQIASMRQPVIDPQFVGGYGQAHEVGPHVPWMNTRPLGEILIDLANRRGRSLSDPDLRSAVRTTWASIGRADPRQTDLNNDRAWVQTLSQGGAWTSVGSTPIRGKVARVRMSEPSPLAENVFALHLYPHLYWGDGRHANLGWLQELPDPMTSAVWNTWIEINMQTAHRLGIRTGDIVRLTTAHGSLEAPAVPYPAIHPNMVAMPIGQGHLGYGETARHGTNPLAILDPVTEAKTGILAYQGTQVQLTKVRDARPMDLVLVQDRPGGAEPAAVMDLIHTTAKEWKTAQPVKGAPKTSGSIFNRSGPGSGTE